MSRTVANHPLVLGFAAVQRARGIKDYLVERRAGVSERSLRNWREGTTPTLANFDAALNVLGFRLVIAPLDDDPGAAVIARQVRRP